MASEVILYLPYECPGAIIHMEVPIKYPLSVANKRKSLAHSKYCIEFVMKQDLKVSQERTGNN